VARKHLPPGASISYAGESKEFKESSGNVYVTFILALLVIYLILAAQFESFTHPVTILLSVPPAVAGALLALALCHGTMNIYSQIGLMILIGLVTKNAILIVEFANQLLREGKAAGSAIIEASVLRLRPIVMTTVATILAALPLALATGAGAAGPAHRACGHRGLTRLNTAHALSRPGRLYPACQAIAYSTRKRVTGSVTVEKTNSPLDPSNVISWRGIWNHAG